MPTARRSRVWHPHRTRNPSSLTRTSRLPSPNPATDATKRQRVSTRDRRRRLHADGAGWVRNTGIRSNGRQRRRDVREAGPIRWTVYPYPDNVIRALAQRAAPATIWSGTARQFRKLWQATADDDVSGPIQLMLAWGVAEHHGPRYGDSA